MNLMVTILIVGFFAWYVIPHLIKKLSQSMLRRRCREQRVIVLTYDDGPSATLSEKIIHLLDKYNVKASFFVLGHKLETAGRIIKSIVQARHEIGSHSFRHLNAWKQSPLSVYRDIDRGLALTRVFGPSRLFRPPHGKATIATMIQIWMNNCKHAWWTIDSSDTWDTLLPVDNIIERIKGEGGGVILMHDHDRANHREQEEYVIELTERILELARSEGFKVCPMSELHIGQSGSA